MTTQLTLTTRPAIDETDREWLLDEQTRDLGMRRLAEARALLRTIPGPAAVSGEVTDHDHDHDRGVGHRHAA